MSIAVVRCSGAILAAERYAVTLLMGLLAGLILLNVITRYAGVPLYWVDESAIYSVVWLTFVGASAMTRLRLDFAVTMLTERLAPGPARIARMISLGSVVGIGAALGAMCWIWMDPIGIAASGFDAKRFAGETFNFLYTERTQTLNWPTWIIYLVLPLFSVTLIIHGLANLVEDLGWSPRQHDHGFSLSDVAGVN